MKKISDKPVFIGTASALVTKLKTEEKEFLAKQDADPDKAFDCVCCTEYFVPQKGQWIFHDLCNKCFFEFDDIKMTARFKRMDHPNFGNLSDEESNWDAESVEKFIESKNKTKQ